MACAEFILAGAENFLEGAEKKSGLPDSRPKGAKFFSAPPAEQTRGGGKKTLLYLEKERETFNDRSLSNPQLTLLFFL